MGQGCRPDDVAEQDAHLAALGLLAASPGGHRRRQIEADDEIVDAGPMNAGNRVQQTLAMTQRRDAELNQVGVGQVADAVEVDRVRSEARGVLAQPQFVEPRSRALSTYDPVR